MTGSYGMGLACCFTQSKGTFPFWLDPFSAFDSRGCPKPAPVLEGHSSPWGIALHKSGAGHFTRKHACVFPFLSLYHEPTLCRRQQAPALLILNAHGFRLPPFEYQALAHISFDLLHPYLNSTPQVTRFAFHASEGTKDQAILLLRSFQGVFLH